MKKIFITGATGFIGSHLAELCVEQGDLSNEISNDPTKWWYSKSVRKARKYFQDNVCLTSSKIYKRLSYFFLK
jgi:nucleoside-diphosphate-sugar epimerase